MKQHDKGMCKEWKKERLKECAWLSALLLCRYMLLLKSRWFYCQVPERVSAGQRTWRPATYLSSGKPKEQRTSGTAEFLIVWADSEVLGGGGSRAEFSTGIDEPRLHCNRGQEPRSWLSVHAPPHNQYTRRVNKTVSVGKSHVMTWLSVWSCGI
jgi:hypothetical protein